MFAVYLAATPNQEMSGKSQQWTGAVEEMLRTATSSVKCRPMLERLVSSLQTFSHNPVQCPSDRCMELVSDFKEVQAGMRRREVQLAEEALRKFLWAKADHFLQMEESDIKDVVRSKDVQPVLQGLEIFKSNPQEFELAGNLRSWMTKLAGSMAAADLMDFAVESEKSEVADLDALGTLLAKCPRLRIPSEDLASVVKVASLVLSSHRSFLVEAGSLFI